MKYPYKLRPGYGSKQLLIELCPKDADSVFMDTLVEILKPIGLKIESIEDLWMNDEILLSCQSKVGNFILSKDVWGFVFIMAPENQSAILEIDSILETSEAFEKHPVS